VAEAEPTARLAREMFFRQIAPATGVTSAARIMAGLITDVFYEKGAQIYRAGDAPQHIFFIVHGTVHLEAEGSEPWVFQDRSVIGAIDAFLERPRARTATCKSDVHVLRLGLDDWHEVMEEHFELTRGILRNSLSGLRSLVLGLAPAGGFSPVPEPLSNVPGATIDHASSARLNIVERIIVLRDVGAFRRAGIQVIASLAEHVEELRLAAGDTLSISSRDRSIVLVVGGVVELEGGEPHLSARFSPRAIVGGISMLTLDPASAASAYTLKAATSAILFRLRTEDLFDVMEDHHELARALLAHGAEERERLLLMRQAGQKAESAAH
jgi:CRP-like cAMP-binding protein